MEKENIISTNFIMTNRDIIAEFGVNSAVMLGELYGRMNYFRKRNELKYVSLCSFYCICFSFCYRIRR